MLWTVNYYDDEGRIIKVFDQHYKGSTLVAGNYDEITNLYDFTGAVISSIRSHKVASAEQVKVLTEYEYDHTGRKTNTWQTINSNPRVLMSQLVYNELGQLFKKNLHSTNNGVNFLQTITYTYNERGWLLNASAPKLDVKLRYQIPTKGAAAQFNGNISEFEYTGEKSGNRWFKYTYDKINRLTNSVYSTTSELDEVIAYDKAGNISSLKRGPAASTPIAYTYANAGLSNQLSGVTGGLTGIFTYNTNGSAISDGTRGITSITYNQLNLPATVTGSQTATYVYDAVGTKVKSTQAGTIREYISGIHYKNNVLDLIATEEGRAVRSPIDGSYRYEYNLKDNLGNIRVSFDDNGGTARVIQEDEYYAFGLNRQKFLSGDKNNYLYNGKEEQEVLTDEYDYGARFYDPMIGRWNVIDPLAEKNRRFSPYVYVDNNPLRFIDPDGMEKKDWFVNNLTGQVLYVKGQSKITQGTLDKMNYGTKPSDYERLGADDMFGSKVSEGIEKNILNRDAYFVGNSEGFMKGKGYEKVERATVQESQLTSGGNIGEERIKSTITEIEQVGDAKLSYVKADMVNKKVELKESSNSGAWSSISRARYDINKPVGQSIRSTAYFYENRSPVGSQSGSMATFINEVIKVFKAVF
ncbi:type IV secretion protein Rhs [Pedobacter ginsengisoli]|uniref:Type IV secretion protein Rhs n=2 Tax=Pedobacter ginsengisoli TaxID=363852 RepID=A0A2D1UCD3_9SPHI|nr:type IV secretion protein Rhs [Pedobacter ginsengisoli]